MFYSVLAHPALEYFSQASDFDYIDLCWYILCHFLAQLKIWISPSYLLLEGRGPLDVTKAHTETFADDHLNYPSSPVSSIV